MFPKDLKKIFSHDPTPQTYKILVHDLPHPFLDRKETLFFYINRGDRLPMDLV